MNNLNSEVSAHFGRNPKYEISWQISPVVVVQFRAKRHNRRTDITRLIVLCRNCFVQAPKYWDSTFISATAQLITSYIIPSVGTASLSYLKMNYWSCDMQAVTTQTLHSLWRHQSLFSTTSSSTSLSPSGCWPIRHCCTSHCLWCNFPCGEAPLLITYWNGDSPPLPPLRRAGAGLWRHVNDF
jgi:hypothetical protein